MLHSLTASPIFAFFDLPFHNELYLKCTQLKCFFYLILLFIFHLNCINGFCEEIVCTNSSVAKLPTHSQSSYNRAKTTTIALHFFMFAILIMKKHRHYSRLWYRRKWMKFNRARNFVREIRGWKILCIRI